MNVPKLEMLPHSTASSLIVKREIAPYMDYPWHYHPEYEIIYVEKSYGVRFMGNHIGNFFDGDLMFIGSNLPHVWKNDSDFYQGNKNLYVDVYVIHFREDALGKDFFQLPEFTSVRKLFQKGQQGVLYKGDTRHKLGEMVKSIVAANGIERLALFLKTLETFSRAKNFELLSSPGYSAPISITDLERINVVIDYIVKNFTQEISIDELARLSNLTKSSFCRYFKAQTHKTCTEFINEVRILNACKMLQDGNASVSDAAYGSGYNNISHFNRQFKFLTGYTAKEYRKKHYLAKEE